MPQSNTHSRHQGDPQRRRRNRGGKNRRNQDDQSQRNDNQRREFSPGRDSRVQQRHSDSQGSPAPRKYAPAKLTWWQKMLKLVGLYKEQAPPGRRPATPPADTSPRVDPKVKSNTRNLRSGESGGAENAPQPGRNREPRAGGRNRPERSERPERPERGERSERSERRGGDRNSVESPRVYVGNLSYDVSESDLQELFKGIGGVRNVEIVYNRSTHRSKGYGFVEMLHVDEAKRAVEVLHDQHFMGRPMTVSGAKSKGLDEREDRDERDERQERQERQERRVPAAPAAPAAAAATAVAAAVTTEQLGDSGQITTIIETPESETPVVEPALLAEQEADEAASEAASSDEAATEEAASEEAADVEPNPAAQG
jgi:hypothetical protein